MINIMHVHGIIQCDNTLTCIKKDAKCNAQDTLFTFVMTLKKAVYHKIVSDYTLQ